MTVRMFESFPDFGKSVAIDSTDIKAWSNAGKKGKKRSWGPSRGPKRRRGVSDPDAGWVVKTNTEGRQKYVWGYKVHILFDTTYELPIATITTKGNVHDSREAAPLLQQARYTYSKFRPDHVICDAAYSDRALRKLIRRQYRAEPIIDPNPQHKKAVGLTKKTAEWRMIYNRRTAVERLNGPLKADRRLNHVRVSPNPPKDTDGRREESGRGVRELQGK